MNKTLNMLQSLCGMLPSPVEQRQAMHLIAQVRKELTDLRTQDSSVAEEAASKITALEAEVLDLNTQLRIAKGQITKLKKKVEKLSENTEE